MGKLLKDRKTEIRVGRALKRGVIFCLTRER